MRVRGLRGMTWSLTAVSVWRLPPCSCLTGLDGRRDDSCWPVPRCHSQTGSATHMPACHTITQYAHQHTHTLHTCNTDKQAACYLSNATTGKHLCSNTADSTHSNDCHRIVPDVLHNGHSKGGSRQNHTCSQRHHLVMNSLPRSCPQYPSSSEPSVGWGKESSHRSGNKIS